MKKTLTIALALVFALTMATGAFAAYGIDVDTVDGIEAAVAELSAGEEAQVNMRDLVNEIAEAVGGVNVLAALVNDFLDDAGIDIDSEIPEGAGDDLMALIIEAMAGNDEDGALAEAASGLMSNDFINFLAGLYIPVCPTASTTARTTVPPTGDSSTIAIGAFAVVSLAAAAAFVCLKKKEK